MSIFNSKIKNHKITNNNIIIFPIIKPMIVCQKIVKTFQNYMIKTNYCQVKFIQMDPRIIIQKIYKNAKIA